MSQDSEWTVGPLSSATCPPMFMQLTGCHQPVLRFGQKVQLTGRKNTNYMRNAKCADKQTSNEGPYCSFLYCASVFVLLLLMDVNE